MIKTQCKSTLKIVLVRIPGSSTGYFELKPTKRDQMIVTDYIITLQLFTIILLNSDIKRSSILSFVS